jgi:hypothetical protein
MKARFNGKEIDVIEVSGPELYGIADGLLWGVGVEEGEFPDKGTAASPLTVDWQNRKNKETPCIKRR